jgi:flagellar basal body-associated protein FliL
MAEEKDKQNEAAEGENARPRRGKKGIFLGGGIISLVAAAYAVFLVAIPSKPVDTPFKGPWVTTLTAGDVQVNLKGESSKRYMVVSLQAEYDAYDDKYAATRVADPLFGAKLLDTLISLGRQKTREQLDDHIGEETFKEEVRVAVDPLVFPLHVGNAKDHTVADEESGLIPGRSSVQATMRGGFNGHELRVDQTRRTIVLDNGVPISFSGTETDLLVENEHGLTVFVNVSQLQEDFVGSVRVGTFGHIREILFSKFLVQ